MMMKRVMLVLVAAVLLAVSLQGAGWAHPPRNVDLTYRTSDGVLVVTVFHGVKNPSKHFVERLSIYVAGKKIREVSFTEQTTKESLVADIPVGTLAPGTEVRVEATCSIFGTASGTLVIS